MMRRLFASIALVALSLLTPVTEASADLVVVPGAQATAEGNVDNAFPFNLEPFGYASMRYQQIYGASAFSGVPGPVLITQISFRPDATFGAAFASTLSNVRIDLSTTSTGVNSLSTTFASNVGSDNTTVVAGALSLSSVFAGPAAGPKAFDIVIDLATAFVYDPTRGNLLMDVRNFGGGRTTQFDAQDASGDAIARVSTTDNVNSLSGSRDTIGLVTQFTYTAVPEPASILSCGLGLVGVVAVVRRRLAA